MALTKYDIASAGLIMCGANPVTSFSASGSTEQKICFHLYQSVVDNWLSMFPWRFATKTTLLSRDATGPDTKWQGSYTQPSGMKSLQAINVDRNGDGLPFDRFENKIFVNAGVDQNVYAVYTYEPPISWWPGYFVSLMETACAQRFAFAIAGKLDLTEGLTKILETSFMLAKNADSRQQTTRKFKVSGHRSIMEMRRS
jgi:hypothetical protein